MSELKEFLLPDIGADAADVTEILVSVGDVIVEDQDVMSIEGDKASMDVPAAFGGTVKEIKMNVGDSVSEGQVVLVIEVAGAATAEAPAAVVEAAPVAEVAASELKDVCVPDIGGDEVEVTEVLVSVGDVIAEDQDILSVEGDKASMDVPAPFAGTVKEIKVASGDKVSEGTLILVVEAQGSAPVAAPVEAAKPAAAAPAPVKAAPAPVKAAEPVTSGSIKASPSVRRIAREFDLDLARIPATGKKGRRTMYLPVRLVCRVLAPLVDLPQGVQGWRPPEALPSPPPIG